MLRRCNRGADGAELAAAVVIFLVLANPIARGQGAPKDMLGGFKLPEPRESLQRANSAAAPMVLSDPLPDRSAAREGRGPFVAYCVRLCDGRFFPLARSHSISPAEQCRALCPAAKTKIFGGGSIEHAVAADGGRYANLDTAFLYRTRIVGNCTCNGRDALGLAPMNIARDPTLRAGDIVAAPDGFKAYAGTRSWQSGEFTPVAQSANVPPEVKRRLSQTQVLPSREVRASLPASASGASKSARRGERSAQLFR